MKKIMITLCTLLAVNAGSTMYAPPVAEGKAPEKGKTEKAEPGKSGTAGKPETGPSAGEKANIAKKNEAPKPSEAPSYVTKGYDSEDGYFIQQNPSVADVASAFNLDPKDGDSVFVQRDSNQKPTAYTLKRADGTSYKVEFDPKTGKISKTTKIEKGYSTGKEYDPVAHDKNGNPVTKNSGIDFSSAEEGPQVNTQNEIPTPTAPAENLVMTPELEVELKSALDNPENIPALVEAAAPKGTTAEQKSSFVQQIKEFVTSGAKSVAELFTFLKELISPTPVEVTSPEMRSNQASTGSPDENYNKDNGLFKNGDASGPGSPGSVADVPSLRDSEVRPQFNQYVQPKVVRTQ